MSFDQDAVDLPSALLALALLTPESEHADQATENMLHDLRQDERLAIGEFFLEGQRCLGRLSGGTLSRLSKFAQDQRSISAHVAASRSENFRMTTSTTQLFVEEEDEEKGIYELFDEFDKNKDGLLSHEEFKEAFAKLAGDGMSSEQLDGLMKAYDVNGDGVIDIHEFTVWLYGGKKQSKDPKVKLAEIQEQLKEAKMELRQKQKAIDLLEDQHEEEMDATHDFWKEAAKSLVVNIDTKVDLETADWLGNGKYGFVLKATRREDGREVVVKMMGHRWAHLAVQEWQHGSMVGKHPNIVDYEEVMLHSDEDRVIQRMLEAGMEAGTLKSRTKRKKYPDRFICLTQELMNQGTVQDWMDKDMLLPSGIFNVIHNTAKALAYMHQEGVTHNDIKPENIMLHRDGKSMVVKLGDLGLATKSEDVTADFWQTGMTVFCMATGEKFGSRKYRLESVGEFVADCQTCIEQAGAKGKTKETMATIPKLLTDIFGHEVDMATVRDDDTFSTWDFFASSPPKAAPAASPETNQEEQQEEDSDDNPCIATKTLKLDTEQLKDNHMWRASKAVGGAISPSANGLYKTQKTLNMKNETS